MLHSTEEAEPEKPWKDLRSSKKTWRSQVGTDKFRNHADQPGEDGRQRKSDIPTSRQVAGKRSSVRMARAAESCQKHQFENSSKNRDLGKRLFLETVIVGFPSEISKSQGTHPESAGGG